MDQKLTLRRLNQLYADLDLPALKPVAHTPKPDPEPENPASPLEGQSPDLIVLPEPSQIEPVDTRETVQLLNVSELPVTANPVPVPVQMAVLPSRPPENDGPRQADWKAIGIGAVTGSLVSGMILLVTSQMHIFSNPGRLALWSGEMFLGILGALIANSWKSTVRELWMVSIEWVLFPVWFALLIGFILLLLTFTSLTG